MRATSSLSSLMPVNGSHEFASSVPTAARVASTAAAGGGMSVSKFSMRSISGSLPAAAATLSIENPGMPFSRSPMGRNYPGAGRHAPLWAPRRPARVQSPSTSGQRVGDQHPLLGPAGPDREEDRCRGGSDSFVARLSQL